MSRGGTDWGTLALLGVSAVVAYELLGKVQAKPAPAAPAPTTPTAPKAPTTPQNPAVERGTGPDWWTAPALRMPGMSYATSRTTQTAQTAQGAAAYRPSALAIMPRVRGVPSGAATRFMSAQQARLDAQDVARALPVTATQPIPPVKPADTATYVPSGTDYGNIASFQSQISQTTYQDTTDTSTATESAPEVATVATQDIPDVQPADQPVYTPPEFSDEPVDYGDPTQFRRGGE